MSQTAKQIAKQVAKNLAREPLEILKTAREQLDATGYQDKDQRQSEQKTQEPTPEEKQKKEMQSQRLMSAYQSEIEDIRKQEVFKDLQRRISDGEDISVTEYTQLTPEQRQVLEAQKQAVR